MEPLKDIKVLAVTVYLAGPFCSMNLARMGAEVIKVEIPGKGDPVRGNGPICRTGRYPRSAQDRLRSIHPISPSAPRA